MGVRLPPLPRKHSDIAQLVEQFIRNEPVARSSRAVGAIWRGSLIGKAMNDKLYEFQEDFMNIAKAKIRQLVEAEKKRLKENHFNF